MVLIKGIIQKYAYLVVVLLALVLRIYNLNLNPVGIVHDEVHDLINAKSLALTGENAPGTVAGIFTKNAYCDGNCIFGELASFILIPWMKIMPLDIFWSKIPFLIASLGIVYFGGKLFENISGKRKIGILTSLLIAINPWAIHFGRTAFENLFSFCFYLMALYFFTKKEFKKKEILFGSGSFILGFLCYMGAKPVFPFLVLMGIIYRFLFDKKKNLRQLIIILGLLMLFFGIYYNLLKGSAAGSRLVEVKNSSQLTTNIVNEERRISLEVPMGRDMLTNKILVKTRFYLEKYMKAFSPENIFWQSDQLYDVFNIPNVGYLYLIDFVFVFLGIIYLAKKSFKKVCWCLGLIAVIPITSVISESGITFALRSGLIYPLLIGLAAIGLDGIYYQFKKGQKIFLVLVVMFYILSLIYFWGMYMYRAPMAKSSAWFGHERLVVRYLDLLKKEGDRQVVVVSKDPVDLWYLYAFYTKKYDDKNFINKFNDNISKKIYEFDNIKIENNCPEKEEKGIIYIFQKDMGCVNEPNNLIRISEPRDGGAKFFIKDDVVCNKVGLNSYPYPRNLKEFDVEKMNKETFCKIWVSKP